MTIYALTAFLFYDRLLIMDKIILHCDANNFFASVECILNPALKDFPIAVAGDAEKKHGVILAKNYKAREYGVKTGDVIWQAKQKCPGLQVVKPHFAEYTKYSKLMFSLYEKYTCFVEPFGADECWLDCTGSVNLFGDGAKIADDIRKRVKTELGLTISVGISFNKIFAKIGSDKCGADSIMEITQNNFKSILYPLPARELFMVGAKTAEALSKLNIMTIGNLAGASPDLLKMHFGINGLKLLESARGENKENVRESSKQRTPESIGHGMTAARDIKDFEDAEAVIYYLCELVATRLRKKKLRGGGLSLNIRDVNLFSITRQAKIQAPTCSSSEIGVGAMALLRANWNKTPALRTLTVSVYDLSPIDGASQMNMFEEIKHNKNDNLEKAVDKIREKYGSTSIVRGNLIEKDFIYDKSDDEDFLPFKR